MKTIRYKLTNQDIITHNGCQWELNQWKETSGYGNLCSYGWLHCYSNPLFAILLNSIHANIRKPRLFKVEVEGKTLNDNGLKEGWNRMRLIKELDIPEINSIQKVAFGILCALEVCINEKFKKWANNWLSGEDRTKDSADAADAAYFASGASSDYYVNYSVTAAYYAALSASYSVTDGYYSAVNAAYYVANSAHAASSFCHAAYYNKKLNLIDIANKAMEIK